MATNSKSQYRKMLAALRLGAGPDGSGESGHLAILPAVTVALGLVAAVVTHRPEWLGAAPPIIRDSGNLQDERDELLNYCCEPPLLLAA